MTAGERRAGPRLDRRARARQSCLSAGAPPAPPGSLAERSRGSGEEQTVRPRPRRAPRDRRPLPRLGRRGLRARLRRRGVRRREGWRRARSIAAARGGPRLDPLPESEAAFVRLRLQKSARGRRLRAPRIAVEPPEFSRRRRSSSRPSRRTRRAGAGRDRSSASSSTGRSSASTAAAEKGLLSEDGALETGRGDFSVEPFLAAGRQAPRLGRGRANRSVARGRRPADPVRACAPTRAACRSRSRPTPTDRPSPRPCTPATASRNSGAAAVSATLYLALRPVQVNPPWQFLLDSGRLRADPANPLGRALGGRRRTAPPVLRVDAADGLRRHELRRRARSSRGSPTATCRNRPTPRIPTGFASAALSWELDDPSRRRARRRHRGAAWPRRSRIALDALRRLRGGPRLGRPRLAGEARAGHPSPCRRTPSRSRARRVRTWPGS